MLIYIAKRLLLMIPTILGVLTLTFVIIQFVPGGPVETILAEARAGAGGDTASYQARRDVDAKQVEELKKLYGFDKPPLERYFSMLASFAQFDLGKSYLRNKDVWSLIKERFPISLFYGIITLILTYSICIPLGVLKAIKHRTFIDSASSVGIFLGYSIPGFALGTILVLLFAFRIEVFPIGGFTSENFDSLSPAGKIKDLAHHAALPLISTLMKMIGDMI